MEQFRSNVKRYAKDANFLGGPVQNSNILDHILFNKGYLENGR